MFLEKLKKKASSVGVEQELTIRSSLQTDRFHANMHLTRSYLIEKKLVEIKKTGKLHHHHPYIHHNDKEYINLDLSNKRIASMDTNSFSHLKLVRLNLSSNELTSLDSATLNGMNHLKEINLSSNRLTHLDAELFHGLKKRESRFTNNIKSIFSSSAARNHRHSRVAQLTQIDLKNNQLTQIQPSLFNGLTNLESISLKSNKLTILDPKCFSSLINLKTIEFSFNQLTSLDPKCFQDLVSLRKMDFSRNNIKVLNGTLFNGLINLEEINFSENKIEAIDSNLFRGLTSLKAINLGHNKISSLDDTLFDGLNSLEIINLEFNNICLLESFTFQRLTSLKEINLYNNQLTVIGSKIFRGLRLLEYIYCSFNKINYIDTKSFRGLANLKAIHLSFNEIISLERKLFKGLTNLNEILLEHNQISHIDAKVFKGLTYLNKINLSNNLISSIDPAVFASLNIRRIELNENYLSKECQFSLVRNLPKNVITAVRQKELSHPDGMPININSFIDSMQRKELLMNRKLHQEIEKRKKLEEKFQSLSAQSSSMLMAKAKASRCSLRSNKSITSYYFDATDNNQMASPVDQMIALHERTSQSNENHEDDESDTNEDPSYLPDVIPSEIPTRHRLSDEIERIVQEHIKIDLIDDLNSNVWQMFHEEGEMKIYKRDLEKDGIVLDPLKAVHKVKGITAHELCHYFFDPDIRMEWEATLESCKLVEKLASDSLIFHQVIKRVWPSAQRDSCFWSHIRSFDQAGSSKSTGLKSWIVVNYSTDHANAPLKDGIVRAQANVAMICSTEITNKKKEHNLSACTRDDIACNITYVSQVNPGGWVPAKALRAVYKNVYPKFVKGFGEFVIQKTKNKEILF